MRDLAISTKFQWIPSQIVHFKISGTIVEQIAMRKKVTFYISH